jgi:ecotin
MIKKTTEVLLVILAALSLSAAAAENDNIHMFPQPKEGSVRHVIEVPKTDNDYEYKVELMIGKSMLVDCNHRSLSGKIEDVTLKGWGYKYIEVKDIKNGPTTMMACRKAKTEKFIFIRDTLRRYNSRSPIVVYVPKGYEVRYRIWSAGKKVEQAEKR